MEFGSLDKTCPNCGGLRPHVFHRIAAVPVNSCLLFSDRRRARDLECGDIDLAFCPDCSFIYNAAWKSEQTTYSEQYEETQQYSETFSEYQKQQVKELLDRYGINGKDVVEIGCGKGEFLSLVCQLGRNRGVGYDPSFIPARRTAETAQIEFKREFFTAQTKQTPPDFVCCKMTLEHISQTQRFVAAIRNISSAERGTIVFIQVPDVRRILSEAAFWDVYYEHCSYFSPISLQYLLRDAGFEVLRVATGFGDQYLTIEARVAQTASRSVGPNGEGEARSLRAAVVTYDDAVSKSITRWNTLVRSVARSGGRTVLWGSGSKAVAFLAATKVEAEIDYLVDINPYRWGKFVPGSGKEIMPPEFLSQYQPDLVIAMNPIYAQEIARALQDLGCSKVTLRCLGEESVAPLVDSRVVGRAADSIASAPEP
jgi:hypothetical protein